MSDFEKKCDQYARLVVEVGANVQEGEWVVVNAPLENPDFAHRIAKFAYERGAHQVDILWNDEVHTKMHYNYAPIEAFESVEEWKVARAEFYGEKKAVRISISASDPELLKGIDPVKVATSKKTQSQAFKHVMKYTMNDIVSWCVVSIPSRAWAKKVFDETSDEKAIEKLWDAIFSVTRMDEADPIAAWQTHLADLKYRAEILNEKRFKKLHYKSENGTDLEVLLPTGHIWMSGASTNSSGTRFVANMPTEEVFTMPHSHGVNGTLVSTKPLIYSGNVIDKFQLVFQDGEVVDYSAQVGEVVLKELLNVDPNAKRLGEVALVPFDSPISNANLLFYNTLFDENASCHFAFGQAYPTTIENGENLEKEALDELGVNDSLIHEDFMVGAPDLSIVGTTEDGEEVQIFINGNWAF